MNKLMKNGFSTDPGIYVADDCIPLRQAVSRGDISMKALVHGHYPGEAMPKKTLPGLLSVGYWNAEEPQDWGLDWHRNEGLELSFMKSGHVDFSTVDYTKASGASAPLLQLAPVGRLFFEQKCVVPFFRQAQVRVDLSAWNLQNEK